MTKYLPNFLIIWVFILSCTMSAGAALESGLGTNGATDSFTVGIKHGLRPAPMEEMLHGCMVGFLAGMTGSAVLGHFTLPGQEWTISWPVLGYGSLATGWHLAKRFHVPPFSMTSATKRKDAQGYYIGAIAIASTVTMELAWLFPWVASGDDAPPSA